MFLLSISRDGPYLLLALVRIAYERSTLPAQEQQSQLIEINRRRIEAFQSNEPAASKEFILCGVDPETIAFEKPKE